MEKHWKLSSLDLFTLNMTIKGAWLFRSVPDVSSLETSLKQLLSVYPHLLGHYREDGKCIVWNDADAVPQIRVLHRSDLSADQIAGNQEKIYSYVPAYDNRAFKDGNIQPFSATLVMIRDGAILYVQCAHAAMDGYSFYTLVSQWAALTRGGQIRPMTVDQSNVPTADAMPKDMVIAAVEADGWVKMGFGKLAKMLWNMSREKRQKGIAVLEVPQQRIEELKKASGAGTNAVLTAIITHKLAAAAPGRGPFAVNTVADLRGHIANVPADFMGNMSQPFITDMTFEASLDEVTLAQQIQKCNTSILESDRLDRTTRLSVCASAYSLPYHYFDATEMSAPVPSFYYINNQLKFRACEIDFGTGAPLYAFANDLPDMIKFWQPVMDGPVQVICNGFAAKALRK